MSTQNLANSFYKTVTPQWNFVDQLSKIGSYFTAPLTLFHSTLVCRAIVIEQHCRTHTMEG